MAPRQRTQRTGLAVSPRDNLPLRTHILEECLPQLSLADLEAVGKVMNRRWEELKAAQQHATLEAHYAHLRALPVGTPLQVVGRTQHFAAGESVTLERPLRPPSTNISVRDRHGKLWRFPMECLISETEDESMRTALGSEIGRRAVEGLQRRIDAAKSEDV